MLTATEIITPRTRGDITRELAKSGKWNGSRQGYRFVLRRAVISGERVILWAVYTKKQLLGQGNAGTVFDVAERIGLAVSQHKSQTPPKGKGTDILCST
jgi:hypothetical protein